MTYKTERYIQCDICNYKQPWEAVSLPSGWRIIYIKKDGVNQPCHACSDECVAEANEEDKEFTVEVVAKAKRVFTVTGVENKLQARTLVRAYLNGQVGDNNVVEAADMVVFHNGAPKVVS